MSQDTKVNGESGKINLLAWLLSKKVSFMYATRIFMTSFKRKKGNFEQLLSCGFLKLWSQETRIQKAKIFKVLHSHILQFLVFHTLLDRKKLRCKLISFKDCKIGNQKNQILHRFFQNFVPKSYVFMLWPNLNARQWTFGGLREVPVEGADWGPTLCAG